MTQDKFFSRQMANMNHTKSNFNNSFQFTSSQQIKQLAGAQVKVSKRIVNNS